MRRFIPKSIGPLFLLVAFFATSFQSPQAAASTASQCLVAFGGTASRYDSWDSEDYQKEQELQAADPLLQVRKRQKEGSSGVLKGTETSPELFNAFATLKGDFLDNRSVIFDQTPSQVLRLIDYESFKNFKTEHPRESAAKLYGVETLRAWKEADDYLASIPVGEFKLSLETLHRVGGLSGRTLKPFPIRIPHITPDLNGSFKFLPNSGRAPLREPLTEEQYQILKKNEWISGFIEMPWPWSKVGSRRGIILYALPHTVNKKLEKLVQWYETNKTTMDPIRLAVEFQRAFVSIHPYVDGNGRASRLLMDRILLEHGLPPSMILDHNMDLYTRIEDYEAAVRVGVADSISLLKEEIYQIKAAKHLSLQISDIDDMGPTEKWADKALVAKYSSLTHHSFRVGDRTLRLNDDGFIYDQFGIPYEYNDGTFYPVSDRMTELYDFGGETVQKKYRDEVFVGYDKRTFKTFYRTVVKQRIHKLLSPLKRDVFAKHLRIVEKLKESQIDGASLKIAPMAPISNANKDAAPFYYSWQQEQFARAFEIKSDSVENLLSPFYTADTTYAHIVRRAGKPSSTQTLAQYEHLDTALYDYEKAAVKLPKLYAAIRAQRELIHRVARTEVMKDMELFEKLSSADKAIAEKDFRFKLFRDYLAISKLSHPTLDAAIKAGFDRYVPVMRNANRISTKFGFIPSNVIRGALRKLPYFKSVIAWVTELQKEVAKDGEDVLKKKVEANPRIPQAIKKKMIARLDAAKGTIATALNGFLDEMTMDPGTQTPYSLPGDRKAWALQARAAGNDEGEGGLSFSTSPELYYNGTVFANGSSEQVAVSVIRAPRKAVIQNFLSSFSNEYEIVGFKPILWFAIYKQYDGKQMGERGNFKDGSPELRAAMRELLGTDVSHQPHSGEETIRVEAADADPVG